MYRQFFGLTQIPFGKDCQTLWVHPQLSELKTRFQWLLKSPGLGLLTAEPGLGKTAALRAITRDLSPHQYSVKYIAETDFGRNDFYRQLSTQFNLTPQYRRAQIWRDLKEHITILATQKNIHPIIIIDEAQNLPLEFLRDFPSFLNFAFDSKDYMTVWLVGHPDLARTIDRPQHAALATRIQARCELKAINDRDAFKSFLLHGLLEAGCKDTILSESGIETLRMSSKGNPRQVHQLVVTAMQLATEKKQSHLSDDVIQAAIDALKQN